MQLNAHCICSLTAEIPAAYYRPHPKRFTFRIMKLTTIFLFLTVLTAHAKGFGQRITISDQHVSLTKLFKQIYQKTGYIFFYNERELKNTPKISIDVTNASLQDVLVTCFKDIPFTYSIVDKTIVIKPKKAAALSTTPPASSYSSNNLTIRGKVTDEHGRPLASVSIVVPGTPLGVMTDNNGIYELSNVPEQADLVVSYIGYIEQRIHIKGRDVINIILKESENELDQTVVIGYGKTTKRFNTGDATTITADVIDKQPVQNVMQALAGRVAGMQITQNNGLPGANTVMQINGQSSFNSGTIPLYVIDGIPYTNFNGGQPPNDNLDAWGISGANGGTSPFSSINPSDIESITVLKDADATAIYGARGANGVVLITTKRGIKGKPKVDINVYTGTGKVGHDIPMLNTQQYLTLRKEAYANDGISPEKASTTPLDLLDWSQTAYTNWQKFLFGKSAHSSNADIAYSGGDKNTQYRISGSFRHDGTVFSGNWRDNRATSRFSLNHHSDNNKFGFNFSASYGYENNLLPSSDITSAYTLPPNYPSKLKDSTGALVWYNGFTNPLSYLKQPYSGVTTNVMGNFSIHYTVLPNLDLKLNAGYTNVLLDSKVAYPASSKNPSNNPVSTAYFSTDKAQNWIIEPTADYTLKTGKNTFNALVGGTFQKNISQTSSVEGYNYNSDLLLGSLVGAGTIYNYYPNYAQYDFGSFYSRLNYNYDGKYILNATFRRDGSSRFGANNRFGNFWAIGGAWIFSQESFAKTDLPFLSFGKLRASYGLTGNDQIEDYQYLPLYSTISTPYQGQTGLYESTTSNPDVRWETDKKLTFALELGLLKNRIMFTGEYFRDRSSDQLTYLTLPTQTGFNSYEANIPAVIQNTGIELTFDTKNVVTKNFTWTTSLNVTFPKNKLLSYPGLAESFYSSEYIVGQPIDVIQLYHYTGVDPTTGVAQYATKSGTGVPDYSTDRVIAPVGTPYYGGISNDFTYKHWAFSFFIQFYHKNGYTNSTYYSPIGYSMVNMNTSVLNRWKAEGDANKLFPGASATAGSAIYDGYEYMGSSDAFWGDASWLKLKNAALSYTFENAWLKRMGLTNFRLYAEGQNLLLFDKNKYQFDPETSVPGGPPGLGTGQYAALPPLRTFVLGINVSF